MTLTVLSVAYPLAPVGQDAVDLGMALVGSDHRVEYCNAAYGEYLGLAPDAVTGASIFGAGCPCESNFPTVAIRPE
mgnify:CR=1 FL=1